LLFVDIVGFSLKFVLHVVRTLSDNNGRCYNKHERQAIFMSVPR